MIGVFILLGFGGLYIGNKIYKEKYSSKSIKDTLTTQDKFDVAGISTEAGKGLNFDMRDMIDKLMSGEKLKLNDAVILEPSTEPNSTIEGGFFPNSLNKTINKLDSFSSFNFNPVVSVKRYIDFNGSRFRYEKY